MLAAARYPSGKLSQGTSFGDDASQLSGHQGDVGAYQAGGRTWNQSSAWDVYAAIHFGAFRARDPPHACAGRTCPERIDMNDGKLEFKPEAITAADWRQIVQSATDTAIITTNQRAW